MLHLKPVMDKSLSINKNQLNNYDGSVKYAPRGITLHATAGSTAIGAVTHWNTTQVKEGTPFVVDKDGTIYCTYDWEQFWTWHLGVGNAYYDKATIGIELVNWLMLKPAEESGKFYTWPNNFKNPFNGTVFKENYRGFAYWEAYPDAQVKATAILCRWLCQEYKINPIIVGHPEHYYGPTAFLLNGVSTHTQFRKDKYDLGPAFNWELFRKILLGVEEGTNQGD